MTSRKSNLRSGVLWLVALGMVLVPAVANLRAERPQPSANGRAASSGDSGTFCTDTAEALLTACVFQAQNDLYVARAICINESDAVDRAACFQDADDSLAEAQDLCRGQHDTRLLACASLGEGRYDPEFDASQFESRFTKLTHPNPYFPLTIGYRWVYKGGTEKDTVEITNATKLIDGVTCIVVHDVVLDRGLLKEDTNDWYAQAKNGDVWYCGEEAKDYENFAGDRPVIAELVSDEGSFKAGREGDKPGIIFLALPSAGKTYVEEASLANAEDVTDILSTTYSYGTDPELDRYVPRRLAELFCSSRDCVVTRNYSLLEPGIFDRKFYARGVGVFLEVHLNTADSDQLVACNFDPRCAQLPIH